jgi:hypothetical protein
LLGCQPHWEKENKKKVSVLVLVLVLVALKEEEEVLSSKTRPWWQRPGPAKPTP